jgi:hypothetical protein
MEYHSLVPFYPPETIIMRSHIEKRKVTIFFYADDAIPTSQIDLLAVLDPGFAFSGKPELLPISPFVPMQKDVDKLIGFPCGNQAFPALCPKILEAFIK